MMKKTKDKSIISVFDYSDYRRFIADLTQSLKAQKSSFNQSYITKKLGLKAPGYLKMIIDGKRNLTQDLLFQFCDLLKIEGRERRYFEALVAYNQETQPDRKKLCFDDLAAIAPKKGQYEIKKNQYQYLSKPYYPCVRELVTLKDFKEDYEWMAKRCLPPISISEAKEAVATLLNLGLLERDANGKLVQPELFVRTEDYDTQIVEAYQTHDAMLSLAREALLSVPQAERQYYTMTLSLPEDKAQEVVEKFYKFRDEIVAILNQTENGKNDEVFQMNFQFFPRTKKSI